MIFSSVPVYLDPPNWHQQQHNHQQGSGSENNPQLPPLPPPPDPHVGAAGAGSIRPGSMADRARLAKIPQPEPAQKCPRCESTNTKFCYFNNYSLSQPRHFCKTCRRYWTKGGSNSGMSSAILSARSGTNQHQQFPFFEPNNGLYPFQSEGVEASSSMVGESQLLHSMSSTSRVSQLAPLKMENNHQGLNLSRLGVSENNQYWGGNGWTDLSGLNSSSTNHLL
ncbi:hypothetical protein REPUB_Repub05bG0179300 [Reevesia pubescens]